jgi:putrescine transport system ATP-binding protein
MQIKVARTNSARHAEAGLQRDQRVHAWWDGSDVVVLTR